MKQTCCKPSAWLRAVFLKSSRCVRKGLTAFIRFYQVAISPLLPPSCRFLPTCSVYAVEAIERHGACKGSYLAARRILRCHPFNPGGYDPVP